MAQQIRYGIGFDVKKDGLQQIKKSLKQIQDLTTKDILNLNKGLNIKEANTTLRQIKKDAELVENALKKAFNTKLNTVNIEAFNQRLEGAGKSVNQIYDSFSRAGAAGENAFRNMSSQIFGINPQLKQSHAILDKMATTLGNTIKWNIASSAVNTLTRSVQQAWGFVKSLDTSLNDIRIVTGKSSEEMGNFAKQANEAAESLGRTTTDYTKAALIYAQQGLDDKEIAKRSQITLKAANVTGQSTDAVSEELTAVWNGYKVNAQEAELYVDRLAAVAATTASDLEELSTGMSKVAAAANELGVGEDQLAAQLSTIISATRQAPETVGTALKTVYARISDIKAGIDQDGVTLGKYSGDMANLGINVLDAQGKLRDMGSIIEEVGSKWQGMTREQQISLAQTMAGQRQYSNLMALFGNFDKYTSALNTAQNAAGTLQQQQDIYMESTAAHLDQLTASIEKIYNSLLDTDSINDLIDGLVTATKAVSNFVESIGGGGNLLKSLGAIGLTVFSRQIAGGIQTTINNLQLAKDQAQQFQMILEGVRQQEAEGRGNDYTQYLTGEWGNLLDGANRIPTELFNQTKQKILQMTEAANKIDLIEQKAKQLTDSFNSVGEPIQRVIAEYETLDDALSSANGVQAINEALQEIITNSEPVSQKLKQVRESFKQMWTDAEKGSPEAEQSFNNLKEQLLSLITTINETKITNQGETFFSFLPKEAQKAVSDAHSELEQLDFSKFGNAEQASKKITDIYSNLTITLRNRLTEIEELMKSASGGELEELKKQWEALQKALGKTEADLERLKDKTKQTINIQDWVNLAGGIAQVGSAIQQIQNLGSIWKNDDLTTGEKLLQTITNLAMSLPLLVNGFTKINGVMKLFSISAKEAVIDTAAQTAANGALGISLEGATVKFTVLNTVMKANIFAAIAGLVLAAAAAFTAFAKAQEEARKQSIQDSKEKIQENKKIHQQVEAHKQLYKSLKELKEQEDNHSISRGELKSAVQDLVNQYGKEDQSVRNLISSYGDLGQKIKELQYQDAKKRSVAAEQDLKESRNIAKKSIETTEGQRGKDFNSKQIDDKYNASFGNYLSKSKPNQEVLKAFREIGGEDAVLGEKTFGIKFSIDYENEEDALKFYEQVKETVEKLNKEVNAETLKDDSTYQGAKEWLKQQKEWAEGLSDAEKNSEKITKIEKVAKEAIRNNEINFDDIETVKQYEAQYEKLVDILGKGEKGKERANEFIRENLEDVYKRFEEPRKFVEDFSKDFAGEMPKSIKDALKNLTPEQYDQLANKLALNPDLINNWDQFKTILEAIAGIDFSNVKEVKQESPDSNKQFFKKQSTEAAETYNQYQPVYEAVQKGESISAQDYEALNPALQEYFNIMYDGTYKMQGDAEQFYQKINNLKISGFSSALDQINNRIVAIENFKNNQDISYEGLQQNAAARSRSGEVTIDQDQVRVQLDYLAAVSDGNAELQEHIQTWNQLLEQHQIDTTNATKIAEEITNAGNKSSQFSEKQKQLIQQAKQLRYEMARALDPTDEDVDEKEKQRLAKIYEEQADKIDGVNDALKGNKYASEQAAEGVLRFDNAILDVAENYEDWMDVLENGNYTDFLGIADELADAYSDLLDLSGNGLLSDQFLQDKEHLEDMQAALNGDTQAYERLAAAANEDIIMHASIENPQGFLSELNSLQAEIQTATAGMNDIQVDARLNDGEFIGKLNELIASTGMSVGQVQALLKNMGYNAVVTQAPPEQHTETVENEYWVPATYKTGTPIIGGGNNPLNPQQSYTPVELDQPGHFESQPGITKSVTPGAGAVKIEQLHKNGGGEVKYQQASSGSKGKMRRSGGGGGGKGKKGKGGGGKGKKGSSSKKTEPDKTQKDLQKKLKDERDIYHDINIQIDKINRTLDRTQKKQDRLYGKQLIKNLNEQTKILEKHKKKLEEKNKLQQQDLKNQRKALKNLGVTFNKYGDISNYMSILGKKQKEVNNLVDKQNKLIKQYNAETNKEQKQKINEQIEKIGKQKSTKEEDLKDLQDRIKNYDELREQIEDVKDQIEEETQKQIEIKIEKFRMKIEIRLEMGEAERDWNKFRRDVLEHTDILKDSDFSKNLKDAQLNYADARSYFRTQYTNTAGQIVTAPGTIQGLTSQLYSTRDEINKIIKGEKSSIYGDNQKQAMQHLKSDLNELMGQMEDYESLIDEINEAYLDTIDNIDDYFNKQIEDYEYVGELIQHDMDLLTLLYGDKNYDAMDKYYSKLQSNNLNQIDSLRRQKDFWKQQWDAAAAAGDTNAAQKFKENYKKVIGDLNSLIQDSAQTLQDQYVNSINKIFDELDKKMTKGQGSDYLNMEWDLMQKNADEYLDTINSAFGIQQTERKYQKAINDSKNLKNQRELKKVMNEQLGILKNKQKLTQYDIDRAQKLLQVEQARIALEDVRSAKTSMRLKRDSQGNYSYQYTADNDAVNEAEDNYSNAVNDLYNFDLERYKGNLQDMLEAWRSFQEDYKEIQLDISLTEEQRIERTALLQEEYGEYINGKTQQNLSIRNHLRESALMDMKQLYEKDVQNFQSMSNDEVEILMQQLVPEWNSGIQQMSDAFNSENGENGQKGFLPACRDSFKEIYEATQEYEKQLDKLAEVAGIDLTEVKSGTDSVSDSFTILIEKNDSLITQMGQQLNEIKNLTTAAKDLSKEYKNVYDQAVKATQAIYDFMQAERDRAKAAADQEAKKRAENAKKSSQQKNNAKNKTQWESDNYSGMLKTQHNQYVAKLSSQGKNQKNNSFNVDAAIKSGQLEQINGADKNIIMGIAGSILLSKSWGDGQTRRKNMIDVFGEQLGKEMYNRVHEYLRDSVVNNEKYKEDIVKNAKWYQSFDLDKLKLNANTYLKAINSWVSQGNKKAVYDTGGYTGDWNSSEGRPAILHEKELVLNKQDTKNILDSVTIMRSIMASMSGNIISKLGSLTSVNPITSSFSGNSSMLQQQVKIQATFPNVNSKKEIEEALSDLVNLAAQRAMR